MTPRTAMKWTYGTYFGLLAVCVYLAVFGFHAARVAEYVVRVAG